MPVIFARFEEHAITGTHDFDVTIPPADTSDAFLDVDVLTVRMRMPCGTSTPE